MKYTTFKTISIFFALIIYGAMATQTEAAPGDLDLTFGSGGKVSIQGNTIPIRVRVQSDGKIMVLGEYAYSSYAFISRNNSDGTPDMSFGSNGLVFLRQFDEENYFFNDFITLPDGKYLIIGEKDNFYALFRYNSNGTPDTSFGTNGVSTTRVGGGNTSYGYSIILQSDGKLIAAGNTLINNIGKGFLIRYNPDGTLDAGFGENGMVLSNEDSPDEIVIQPDGKLLVRSNDYLETHKIIRYNANGTRDNNFGTNSVVNTGIFYIAAIALQSDGKIVVGGTVSQTLSIMERYNRNGTLDTSFGTNGRVTINNTSNNQYDLGTISSIVIQRNDKILTAGSLNGIFAVHRFNPAGTIDNTFGTNGLVTTQMGSVGRLFDITLQPDRKIVAVGDTGDINSPKYVGLVRYLGDPVEATPNNTRFDYDGDRRADISVFRPSNGIWYLNQSTNGFTGIQFGLPTDKLVPADYDGDGKTDIAVFRGGVWYWLNSSNGNFNAIHFGLAEDNPVPADFSGDERAELAVYRNGTWFTLDLSNNQFNAVQFGVASDKPIPADYDGDGKTDYAVYRDGIWYLLGSAEGFTAIQFGLSTDKTVPSDYDADGKTDVAVFRPSDGNWYVWNSAANNLQVVNWGLGTDTLVPADYDGDGKADVAVYRSEVWYIRQTSSGVNYVSFGADGDAPTNQVQ